MKPAQTPRFGLPILAAGVAFLLSISASPTQAQFPNPLGLGSSDSAEMSDTGPSPLSRMASGVNPMNWKMPKLGNLLPSKQEKEQVVEKKDSLVSEVSNTAKRSWKRTKDTLNPMRILPAGFRGESSQPAAKPKEGGFFSSFLSPSSEEKKPEATPIGFLRQDPVK